MYFSVNIGSKNTWKDWGLASATRLYVSPPDVKTEYVDISVMNGSLDFTDSISEEERYKERSGEWEFIVQSKKSWATVFSQVSNYCNGKRRRIVLEDDSEHFYLGRVWVNNWKTEKIFSRIVLNYKVDPFKYTNTDFDYSDEHDWAWNELFNNTIYYGTFKAYTYGTFRTIINPRGREIHMEVTVSGQTKVRLDGFLYNMSGGSSRTFILQPGETSACFKGIGGDSTVHIRYLVKGKSL